jgi:hypothetical protein
MNQCLDQCLYVFRPVWINKPFKNALWWMLICLDYQPFLWLVSRIWARLGSPTCSGEKKIPVADAWLVNHFVIVDQPLFSECGWPTKLNFLSF